MGKVVVLAGILILLAGIVLMTIERYTDRHGLPGDLVWRRSGTTVYFPIVTMILVSIIFTIVLNLVLRFVLRG